MLKSKAILNSNIKALAHLVPEEDRDPQSKLAKFVQKVCQKLKKVKIKWKLVKYKSLIYEIAEFGPKQGFLFWWEEFFDKITFRMFRINLADSWDYFKQGWGSRDFDSGYAMDDFIWKLKRLEASITKYHNHVDWKKDVKRIHDTIVLLERVKEDNYDHEEMKKLDEKWGKSVHYAANRRGLFNDDVPSLADGSTWSFSKRERENHKNEAQINKETRAAYFKAARARKRDWKKALKLIEDHFFEWWD